MCSYATIIFNKTLALPVHRDATPPTHHQPETLTGMEQPQQELA